MVYIILYHRFRKDKDKSENIEYRHEDPYDFESFVAKMLERKYGGKAIATKKSGERGIDIEHQRSEGLFLGQVKCELNNINYVPAAVLYSQMMKQGAVGGYVISVRDFEQSFIGCTYKHALEMRTNPYYKSSGVSSHDPMTIESHSYGYEKSRHSPFGSPHIHSLSFLLNFISFKISIRVLSILFIFLINHTSKIITIAGSVNKYNEMVNVDGVKNAGYKNIAPLPLSLLNTLYGFALLG